jgi:hypothetical protein
VQKVDVEVQHIEPRSHAADFIKHDHEVRNVVAHGRVEAEGLLDSMGQVSRWSTPSGGERAAEVLAILFQPEASGDYSM